MTAIDQTMDIGDLEKPWYVRLFEMARNQPLGTAGALVVLLMVLAAIFANFISPYDPEAASWKHQLSPPDSLLVLPAVWSSVLQVPTLAVGLISLFSAWSTS